MRTIALSLTLTLVTAVLAELGVQLYGSANSFWMQYAAVPRSIIYALPVYESDDALWVFAEEAQPSTRYDRPATIRLYIWILDRNGVVSDHRFRSSLTINSHPLADTDTTVIFRHDDEICARKTDGEGVARYFVLKERGFVPVPDEQKLVEKIGGKSLTEEELLLISKQNGFTNIAFGGQVFLPKEPVRSNRFGWEIVAHSDDCRVVARKIGGKEELVLLDLCDD